MTRFLGSRGAAAVAGLFMMALVSSEASAAPATAATNSVTPAVNAGSVDGSATPLGTPSAVTATVSASGSIIQPQPARTVTIKPALDFVKEASWLFKNGWPLYALVDRYNGGASLDAEANCIATAVYFEARGETPEGQLAVARVVMNRAASGRYPVSWCDVVKQPWQFSFVRNGQFPAIDGASDAWRRAQAITLLAVNNAVPSLSTDVLWYHADYVAPVWGRRLTRVEKIGAHIFYRA